MNDPRRAADGFFDRAPFILFWETTQACDLVCEHCRACAVPERSPDELDTAEGKALLALPPALRRIARRQPPSKTAMTSAWVTRLRSPARS